jgi:hypothetical protein
MSERKYRFALIGKFEKRCKLAGLAVPSLNKHKEQWAADDLLESYDDPELEEAMDYYFKINPRPTWKGYCNNVDRLLQSMKSKKEDEEFRAQMRDKAKEWLSESRG